MGSSNKLSDGQRVERLASEIASDLQMERDAHEKLSDWYSRVAYSALGKIALASLWDITDDQVDSISTDYFKQNIGKHVVAFNHLFELNFYREKASSVLLKMYLQGGLMYQKGNRLVPSMEKKIIFKNIELIRTSALNKNPRMSGFGFYRNVKAGNNKTDIDDVMKFCGITNNSLEQIYKDLEVQADWSQVEQYKKKLRFLDENSQELQWSRSINEQKSGPHEFSLLKNGKGNYQLYFINGEKIYISSLELSLYNNSERKLADSIMQREGKLPKIKYVINKKFAKVKLVRELPPKEQLFFNMYSWPTDSMFEKNQGMMTIEIFLLFHKMLTNLGYKFLRVNDKKYDTF